MSLLLIATALGGCAGAGGTATTASPSLPSAAPPTQDAETGSISGAITDAELKPLSGATIALLETQDMTTSDAEGQYTFNGLAPGLYRVIFSKLGFEDAARKVEVVAGADTRADATLEAVAAMEDPFIVTSQRNVFFNVDSGWAGFTSIEQAYANVSQVHSVRCSPCFAVFHFAPGPVGIQSELTFEGTYVSPAGAPFVIMKYVRNWTDGATGTAQDSNTGTQVFRPVIEDRAFALWDEPAVKRAKQAGDKMMVHYFVSGLGLAVNLKVESWTAFSYKAPLPEEYRILATE